MSGSTRSSRVLRLGITVEGAAAASWAGLLASSPPDGPALVIATGSNV